MYYVYMTKATVQIPKDNTHKHKIVIPKEVWELENLLEGDFIEIDVKKIEKTKSRG
jgi:bifunctional DNA-binding transcriptional regulator/antitoxin component of YhaV-PrlF toxin-antitoxin module